MVERLFQWLDSFKRANMVRAAFGEARQEAGRTVIPVAMVATGVRECCHSASGGDEAGPGSVPDDGSYGFARPMGVISIGRDGVRVHEVVDRTALTLAGLGMTALLSLFLYRLLGPLARRHAR